MKLRHYVNEGARTLLANNLVYGVNFLGNLVMARMLAPHDFGLLALALALVGLVEILTTFSIHTVYVQRRDGPTLSRAIFQLSAAAAAIKILCGALVFLFAHSRYGQVVWILFTLILISKIVTTFGMLLITAIEKQGRFFHASLAVNLANTAGSIVAIICIWMGAGVYGLAMREFLPCFLTLAAVLPKTRHMWPSDWRRIDRRMLRILAIASGQMYIQRAAELSFMRIPALIMHSLLGSGVLGFFVQANYLVSAVNRVTSVANQQIALVFFSRNRKDLKQARAGQWLLVLLSLVLALPVVLVLALVPDMVVKLLWGQRWVGAIPLIRAMAPLALILPLFSIYKSRLIGLRRHNWITAAYAAGLAILVGGLFLCSEEHASLSSLGIVVVVSYAAMLSICGFNTRSSKNPTASAEA